MHRFLSKAAAVLGAAILALALVSCEAPSGDSDGGLAGKYETQDTQGKPMTITLSEDGSAAGQREGETLSGSWKDDGGTAVITWSDEWTTKIAKDGDSYTKTAYKAGSQDGQTVRAEKVE